MAGELTLSPFLSDALVILGAAGIVIPVFARFRITPIIGFILIGVLVGPYGLGSLVEPIPWLYYVTISEPERLTPFADFGIVLLLAVALHWVSQLVLYISTAIVPTPTC